MSKFLENLKKGKAALTVNRAAHIGGKIIFIERGIKAVTCKNHLDPKGNQMKVVIALNPRMNEFTCSCGFIYKFIN